MNTDGPTYAKATVGRHGYWQKGRRLIVFRAKGKLVRPLTESAGTEK